MAFDPRMNEVEGNEAILVGLCGFKSIVCYKNDKLFAVPKKQ